MSAAVGFEEGQVCGREGCEGRIETRASKDCSCHISPPCHSCTAPRNFCPECDWDEAGEPKPEPKPATPAEKDFWAAWSKEQARLSNLPLDNTKVSWRSVAHSSCSMVKEGVCPEGTTREEVRKLVDGTFGGRFESFGGGRFKFIAYTD